MLENMIAPSEAIAFIANGLICCEYPLTAAWKIAHPSELIKANAIQFCTAVLRELLRRLIFVVAALVTNAAVSFRISIRGSGFCSRLRRHA
jgi:hypothetical protein